MPTLTDLEVTNVLVVTDAVATPQVIDGDVTVTDTEQDWNSGTIVISGLVTGDTVSIANIGTGAGQISISGNVISYEGVSIGTFTGGVGGDLNINLTTPDADNNAAIEALLEALRFSAAGAPIITRDLTYTLTDAAANTTNGTITVFLTADNNNNTLKGTANGDDIGGGGGDDLLRGEGGNDDLGGGTGNDNLVGGIGDDTLNGGDDNDTLNGGTGDDDMFGGDGNDTYYVDAAGDTVTEASGQGTDTVRSSIGYTLGANVENLILSGGAFEGHGNGDNNTITGTTSGNNLYGEAGDDTLNGQAGNDGLYGGAGVDTLNGGNDQDVLEGGDDNDVLRGGAGADSLDGGTGADDMDGGTGNDLYYVDDAGDVVGEATANGGYDTVTAVISYTLTTNIERLILGGSDDIDGTGNAGDNRIQGNSGQNVVSGGDGNDLLFGLDNNDSLVGGLGNDSLDGGAGDDAMNGGAGTDTYYIDSAGDTITDNSGDGYDRAYTTVSYALAGSLYLEELHGVAGNGNLILDGNDLDNRIYGADGDDTLIGDAGADVLDGGTGADLMYGGTGNDVYYVDSQSDQVSENVGEGTDTVRVTTGNWYAGDNVELIYGLDNAGQRLGGNTLNNRIEGASGDDILSGGDGADILLGGLGADKLNGNAGDDSLRGGDGNDTYWVDAYDVIIENANEGIDTIYTTVDWTIDDNVENLIMMGTDDLGADGNALNNVMTGNAGWNDLYGGDGDDTLNGGAGEDFLFGEADDDILNGGVGDDLLDGGTGADQMIGGAGDDTYYVDDAGDTTSDSSGIDIVVASASHTIGSGIEVLYLATLAGNIDGTGNSAANLIWGNEGNNVLAGMAGNDALNGDEGQDTLYGGDGNDFLDDGFDTDVDYLYGGAGSDRLIGSVGDFLYGNAGNDEYSVTEDGINIVEYDGEGYDTVYSQITYTLTDFVERLDLSCAGGDIDGTGNAQVNTILGNCHANVLDGAGANDVLYGGDGDDTLIGGLGNDRMSGEDGFDTFVIRNADMVSSLLGQTKQADIILDLDFDNGDRIDLRDIDADINTGGDQDFYFVSTFTKHAGEARLTYNGSNDTTLLQLDVDGDGKADYQVSLYGNHTGGDVLDGSEPVGTGGWLGVHYIT